MTKKTKLGLALFIFLLFACGATLYIIQSSNKSQIVVTHNSPIDSNHIDEPQAPDGQEPEAAKKIFDWTPFIEKYYSKEISKISTDEKIIALTFDGGSNADGAKKILEILQSNNLKATFFLTGKFIEKYPETVKQIIANGHEIGNHSYSHPYFTKLSEAEMKAEIEQNPKLLENLGGTEQPFLRLPYGDRNLEVLKYMSDNGYINIRWTIDSLGWQGAAGGMDKDKVEQRIISKAAPGSIIMMHLGSDADKINLDSEALSEIIIKLQKDGYKFLPLSELLEGER